MFTKTETTIRFNNLNYKARVLNIGDLELVNVCSTVLNKLLVSKKGDYTCEEAKYVDDQIYYFISPSSFTLSDKKLAHKILNEMS